MLLFQYQTWKCSRLLVSRRGGPDWVKRTRPGWPHEMKTSYPTVLFQLQITFIWVFLSRRQKFYWMAIIYFQFINLRTVSIYFSFVRARMCIFIFSKAICVYFHFGVTIRCAQSSLLALAPSGFLWDHIQYQR